MATSALVRSIRDLYEINRDRKALEKREEALKAFFKEQAAGEERVFADKVKGLEVAVVREPRTSVDLKALRLELGAKIEKFESTSTIQKVVVREMKEES